MNDQRQYVNVSIPLEFFPLVSSLLSGLEGFHFGNDEEIGSLILDALMAYDTMPIIESLSSSSKRLYPLESGWFSLIKSIPFTYTAITAMSRSVNIAIPNISIVFIISSQDRI